MNSTLAGAAAAEAPRPVAPSDRIGSGNTLLMLVRRELWEHRALWIAPLVVAALMVFGAIVASVKYHLTHADMSRDDGPQGMTMFAVMQGAVSMPLSVVMLIVLVFYLLDCLYAERKDRSILFWKSLPVSDDLTSCRSSWSLWWPYRSACLRSACCCHWCLPASGKWTPP